MKDRHSPDATSVSRRLRLSSREIAVSIALTLAALVAILAVRFGHSDNETAMTRPVANEARQPR
jgi:hypothetical protein